MGTYEQLDEWRVEALEDFKDHRIVDTDWLDYWMWFWLHLYADLNQFDATFRGVVFRQEDGWTLMVLKVLQEDIPQVVFVSGSSATSCVRKLKKKLRDETIVFTKDKYA